MPILGVRNPRLGTEKGLGWCITEATCDGDRILSKWGPKKRMFAKLIEMA